MKRFVFLLITILCVSEVFADGAKYLIIAPDSFVPALQPLADWKTKKGVLAKVVPLSVTGNTATQIKNYILNAYNTWQIRPEYILLAGASNFIPCWGGYTRYSDDFYANMIGNYQIELSVGRFPCTTVIQINTVVAKILMYERTPFVDDTNWYKKGTSIIREDNYLYLDTMYWNNARYIFGLWQYAGYSHIDSFSRLRGNNYQNVESAINDGRAYVAYQGSGAVANWYSPFAVDTSRMNNGFKLPVVISASEVTMSMSTSGYLGDNLINAGTLQYPKGAIGFWGTTGIGAIELQVCRVVATRGFFRSVFSDKIYKLGDVAKRAKYILDSIHPAYYDTIRYHEWNLYGDPELNLWTAVPKPLTVIYDSIITPNTTNVTVTVMSNGTPVPNALVCIMKDTTIYVYGNTDSNGIRVFSISQQDTGTISITVTARNCHPFEGTIRVLPSGVEESSIVKFQASSFTLQVYPNPAKSLSVIQYSLPVKGQVSLQLFDISGRLVKTLVNDSKNAGDYSVIWNETDENNRKVSEGIYFCILKTDEKCLKQKILVIK